MSRPSRARLLRIPGDGSPAIPAASSSNRTSEPDHGPDDALPAPAHAPARAGHPDLGAPDLRVRYRPRRAGVQRTHRARAGRRRRLPLRPEHHAGDPRRLRPQPAGADPGLPRHREVDAHRAGRGPAQLAVHPHQPRQPHQPHRPGRQGRHRAARRAADHGVPRGDPAVGVPARVRAGVRRVRRRPTRRDVRHPAGAGGGEPPHAPRPVAGPASAPGLSPLRDIEHRRPRGHHRALPRHPADQPGPDGPVEPRRDPELPEPRGGVRDRAREGPGVRRRGGGAGPSPRW